MIRWAQRRLVAGTLRTLAAAAQGITHASTVLWRRVPAWPPIARDQALGCRCLWLDEFVIEVLHPVCPVREHQSALAFERAVGY